MMSRGCAIEVPRSTTCRPPPFFGTDKGPIWRVLFRLGGINKDKEPAALIAPRSKRFEEHHAQLVPELALRYDTSPSRRRRRLYEAPFKAQRPALVEGRCLVYCSTLFLLVPHLNFKLQNLPGGGCFLPEVLASFAIGNYTAQ